MTGKIMKIRKNKLFFMLSLLLSGLFLSCANANGLHNQTAADVTFVFKNFADISGDYTIPGNFNDWDYSKSLITMKNGNGTSSPITISTFVPSVFTTTIFSAASICRGTEKYSTPLPFAV